MLFEENWIENLESQLGQVDSGGGAVGILPTIHDWVFRNNVFISVSSNMNTGTPGIRWENNTFYRLAYLQSGIGIYASLARGDASRNVLINNAFVAGGSAPTLDKDFRGYYSASGAAFTSEVLRYFVTGGDSTLATNIAFNLRDNGYTNGPNGQLTNKARTLTDISQFVIGDVYASYKNTVYDLLVRTVELDRSFRNTFVADYNFVSSAGPQYFPKDNRNCSEGIFTPFNFCEGRPGLNGGNPRFANESDPDGPDNVPLTLDDGLKPTSSSPLCGKGSGGTDIGAYSCAANVVFAGGGVFTPPSSFTLTVTKSGTGQGTVTSSGGSINCGLTCSVSGVTPGTISTLTATPAPGSTFAGWSGGGCSGTETCTVTLNANTTITATFTALATGSTYWYVDNAVTTSGDGKSWATALKNFSNITWSNIKPGDTIYISGGPNGTEKIYRETWTVWTGGTSEKPITIALDAKNNQHNGRVVFDFSHLGDTAIGTVVILARSNIVIDGNVEGQSHFEIRDMVNISSRINGNGIAGDAVSNIILRYLTFTNINNPIHFGRSANVSVHHSHFKGIRGDAAIYISEPAEGWDVNRVYDNDIELLWNDGGPDGVQGGGSLSIYRNRFHVVRTSLQTSTQHTDALQVPGNYLKIYNNEFINVGDSVVSPGSWGDNENRHDIWVFNNIFRIVDALDPFPQFFRIYNNVGKILSYNRLKILNNTFIDNDIQPIWVGNGQVVQPTGSENEIKNNIFYNTGGPQAARSIWTITPSSGYDANSWKTGNNIYYHSSGTSYVTYLGTSHKVVDWIGSFETTGSLNSPTFVRYIQNGPNNDLHLLSGDTVAQNRGANLTSLCTRVPELCKDKDGNSRPASGSWDIGAYEYVSGGIGDTTQPSVSITAPASGATVSGSAVTLSASASDDVGVAGVQFKVDGASVGSEDTTSPYSISWNSTTVSDGSHTITAIARDAAGNTTTSNPISVTKGVVIVPAQDLPCAIGPKTIRAHSVIDGNAIRLVWPVNENRQELKISRRVYSNRANAWQNWVPISANTNALQEQAASEYNDTSVSSGIHYEYEISAKVADWTCSGVPQLSPHTHQYYYQHINTGTAVPLKDQRGKLILLVESGLATPLSAEISRLEDDLVGDGYQVYRHNVPAAEVTASNWKTSVAATKALIRSEYNKDPTADWSIFIVGHVPIPYSGLSSPGSHTDNLGAHPADWYYADMTENVWTDTTVNNTTAQYLANHNVPGDGKFDQTFIPSAPEMRIGRIDLRNMPAFGKTEVELLRQYLNREHAWRHKQFTVRDRALVNANNNIGLIYEGRPFESHSVYSSFFGTTNNTDLGSWLDDAVSPADSYLFAASSGNGDFKKDYQIGTTAEFAATPLYIVFPSMHGSYYGDWNSAMHTDIVLLAPLATEGYAVSNYYRENIMNIDSSSMNEPIGQELFIMASNQSPAASARYIQFGWTYDGNTYTQAQNTRNYVSLMGDPTLRTRIVAPPTNVAVNTSGSDNVISWTGAADTNIQGYHVYRAPSSNLNNFSRLTNTPVTTGSFRDTNASSGSYRYMVRTVKLESSANRSYYNASVGIFATIGGVFTPDLTPP